MNPQDTAVFLAMNNMNAGGSVSLEALLVAVIAAGVLFALLWWWGR